MPERFHVLLKYEVLNVLRSKWIFLYFLFAAITVFFLQQLTGELSKTVLALANLTVMMAPMVAILFSSLYWYHSERFTQLALTQPVSRSALYLARFFTLSAALSLGLFLGELIGALAHGEMSLGFLLVALAGVFLTIVFTGIAMLVVVFIEDRMKGVGLALGIWLFLGLIYDAGLLLLLVAFHSYSLDLIAGVLGTLNPIGLARIVSLVNNNGPLLLGHIGAVAQRQLTGFFGYAWAVAICLFWLIGPPALGLIRFRRKDC